MPFLILATKPPHAKMKFKNTSVVKRRMGDWVLGIRKIKKSFV
jgi:hypothetical protein